ncbi:hypothetical protein, partial [Weissella cibaria]|uniref:hypothetical protein n=1 Tax=Weissella cibaria TaxID=137591 RepID=UPI0019D534F5
MPEKEKPLEDSLALAGKGSSKGSNAIQHGQRIARLSDCKKRSRQMAGYLKTTGSEHHRRIGQEVASCANYLVFNHYYTV